VLLGIQHDGDHDVLDGHAVRMDALDFDAGEG